MALSSAIDINNRIADITPPGPSYQDPAVMTIQNEVGPGGLVSVHLLSSQKEALDKAKAAWWDIVPWESEDHAHAQTYEEAGIWHFQLFWPVRGLPVRMDWTDYDLDLTKDRLTPGEDFFILWVLTGKGERVSEAIEAAGWRYLVWFDQWPEIAWVGSRFHKYAGKTVRVHDQEIRIEAVDWLMDYGIGVGRVERSDE